MLFYQGQLKIGARAAGLVLLLEPVVSSLISHWVWHDQLSETFLFGGLLILIAAVPQEAFVWMRSRVLQVVVVLLALVYGSAEASVRGGSELADPASTHGMLIFGSEHIYLSHLPMFHRPHDYQVLLEVQLDPQSLAVFIADQALHGGDGTFYTFVPESFVLPLVVSEKRGFHGSLYRGHFERGGVVLVSSVSVEISSVLDFEKFVPGAVKPAAWTGFVFGSGADSWLVHKIVAHPDFDQVVHVQRFSPLGGGVESVVLGVGDSVPLADSTELFATEIVWRRAGRGGAGALFGDWGFGVIWVFWLGLWPRLKSEFRPGRGVWWRSVAGGGGSRWGNLILFSPARRILEKSFARVLGAGFGFAREGLKSPSGGVFGESRWRLLSVIDFQTPAPAFDFKTSPPPWWRFGMKSENPWYLWSSEVTHGSQLSRSRNSLE